MFTHICICPFCCLLCCWLCHLDVWSKHTLRCFVFDLSYCSVTKAFVAVADQAPCLFCIQVRSDLCLHANALGCVFACRCFSSCGQQMHQYLDDALHLPTAVRGKVLAQLVKLDHSFSCKLEVYFGMLASGTYYIPAVPDLARAVPPCTSISIKVSHICRCLLSPLVSFVLVALTFHLELCVWSFGGFECK